MDCANCPTGQIISELEAEVKELRAWKRKATKILTEVYGSGIEIEQLLDVKS
jgi:hypothetical protein